MKRVKKKKSNTRPTGAASVPVRESVPEGRPSGSPRMAAALCAGLILLVAAVFGQTVRYGFVNFDDDLYVYGNPTIQQGLSRENAVWAFTHVHSANWHPLTTLSHMLDCQLFGINPAGHHAVNVLLHAASAGLLFLVLRKLTGSLWRSAFVAAVFAIHPLRVESVAWISERKDVLSGLFFMLTIQAYVRYVRSPRWTRYAVVLIFFAAGLLAKPMLVTLPLVLLLLDYWPLQRVRPEAFRWRILRDLIIEKLPFFALSAGSCVITFVVQQGAGAMEAMARLPLLFRVGNALVASITYIGQMFWPVRLAVLYPLVPVELWKAVVSLAILAGVTVAAIRLRRSHPCLLTGWFWYLIMLLPVIGIVQVGSQAHADRYTYLPEIGLAVALTWLVPGYAAGWRRLRAATAGLALLVVAVLAVGSHKQVSCWQNSEALWTHTLSCTQNNVAAYNNLGLVFMDTRPDEAIALFQKAIAGKPDYTKALNNLGNVLMNKGCLDEAILRFQEALAVKPGYTDALNNLGYALMQKGRVDEAIVLFQKALADNPGLIEISNNLGYALIQKGRVDEAIECYQQLLRNVPDFGSTNRREALKRIEPPDAGMDPARYRDQIAKVHYNLVLVLLGKHDFDGALEHCQQAVYLKPGFGDAHAKLGWLLVQNGRLNEAIDQFRQALNSDPRNAEARFNLGIALVRKGRPDEAVAEFEEMLKPDPENAEVQFHLGMALAAAGKLDEAMRCYRKVIGQNPDHAGALNNLAWELATSPVPSRRNGDEALVLAIRANAAAGGKSPDCLDTLAAAYAEAGQFDEAVKTAKEALRLAGERSDSAAAGALERRIHLYEAGQPFRSGPDSP